MSPVMRKWTCFNKPAITVVGVDQPVKKWNPIQHLCHNNAIHVTRPYQCTYHFDTGVQCSRFLSPTQRSRAAFLIDELARQDPRVVIEDERERLLRNILCDVHVEQPHLKKELRRTEKAVEAVIWQTSGPYEKDWKRLDDLLRLRHGDPEKEHTWVRWLVLEVLPYFHDLQTELPWPVQTCNWQDVGPDVVRKFYKQTLWSTVGDKNTELWKGRHAHEFLLKERRRWKPLHEIFGEMSEIISKEGFVLRVAELVEVVWRVIEEMLGAVKGHEKRYAFDDGQAKKSDGVW